MFIFVAHNDPAALQEQYSRSSPTSPLSDQKKASDDQHLKIQLMNQFRKQCLAWIVWILLVSMVYFCTQLRGYPAVPRSIRVPALLALPIIEVSKAAVASYAMPAMHPERLSFVRVLIVAALALLCGWAFVH